MKPLNTLLRSNIKTLMPYSSARDEYSGEALVFLDANESPFNAPYNRYPDPLQRELKEKIAKVKSCSPAQIFVGNGSDEAIDLLFRAFCEPAVDNMVTIAPTYGMYQVSAAINDVQVRQVMLNDEFDISADDLMAMTDTHTKLIFLCSPNNPTGNLLSRTEMLKVAEAFGGLVVVDEAYIDFSAEATLMLNLDDHPNLVILQTLSKAWGLAGIRMGMAFASPRIIEVLNKIKYPYNVNILTQQKAAEFIGREEDKNRWVDIITGEREKLAHALTGVPGVVKVYPSDANFLLVRMKDARHVYEKLKEQGIIVRDRSKVALCSGCLRITIGSPQENSGLIKTLHII